MTDIFLSYKREDREKVRPIVEALQAKGWTIWWDTRIGAGESWDQVIEAQLKAAKCVVVVWTKRSVESDWVRAEAHDARERKCLIPITIEGVVPPSIFKMMQATDLTHWTGDLDDPNFAHVCEGIARVAGAERPAGPAPVHQPPPKTTAPPPSFPTPPVARPGGRPGSVGLWVGIGIGACVVAVAAAAAYFMLGRDRGGTVVAAGPPAVAAPSASVVQPVPEGSPQKSPTPAALSAPDLAKTDCHATRSARVAIAACSDIIAKHPKLAAAYVVRGNGYVETKQYDRALIDYSKAIEIEPRFAAAFLGRGNAYYDQLSFDRAIEDYSRAIEIDPRDALAYNGRGNAYVDTKDFGRAIADYNRALELDPRNAFVYNGRGNAYSDTKDYDRAISDYSRAIDIRPNFAWAYANRGFSNLRRKEHDRALADYNRAIELEPRFSVAYNGRANVYSDRKDYGRAIPDYTRAIEISPRYAWAYVGRGNAYLESKDPDRAVADYNKALEIDFPVCRRILRPRQCLLRQDDL